MAQERTERIPAERTLAEASTLPDLVCHPALAAESEEALAEIIAAGIQRIGADRSAIYLYDAGADRLHVGCARGLSEAYLCR